MKIFNEKNILLFLTILTITLLILGCSTSLITNHDSSNNELENESFFIQSKGQVGYYEIIKECEDSNGRTIIESLPTGDVFRDYNPEGDYYSLHMGGPINGWDLYTSTGRGDQVIYSITPEQTIQNAVFEIKYSNVRAFQSIEVFINNNRKGTINFTPEYYWSTPGWSITKIILGKMNAGQAYNIKFEMSNGGGCGVNLDKFRIFENPIIGDKYVMQRWGTQMGGYWDAQKYISGDFNGDGKNDIARIFNDSNLISMDVLASTGSTLSAGTGWRWLTKSGGWSDSHQFIAGDFNGDRKCDIAFTWNEGGYITISVFKSNGNSFNPESYWIRKNGGWAANEKVVAGDFNNDGKCDIAVVWNDSGNSSIAIFLSTGNSFAFNVNWGIKQGSFYSYGGSDEMRWLSGDFNGDGKLDIANVFKGSDNKVCIDVHYGNGLSFYTWGRAMTGGGYFAYWQKWLSGDFNNDGKTDIANSWNYNGNAMLDVYLGASSIGAGGIAYNIAWATYQGRWWDTQKWFAGDFNGDGRCDIGKSFGENGATSTDIHISSIKYQY